MPKEETFVAFLSYRNRSDELEEGRITRLRERLEKEIELHLGAHFRIFQDRKDVRWGQHWERLISDALERVTLLIPVLTPGFFQSDYCRGELQQFRKYEQQRNRDDLILPIHYVEVDELTKPEEHAPDEMVALIRSRQMVDWREFRHSPLTDPNVGRTLETLAKQARAALRRGKPKAERSSGSAEATTTAASAKPPANTATLATASAQPSASAISPHPSAHTEPVTLVVDPYGRKGRPFSIQSAIQQAPPGARILVPPGLYEESLVLDKPLEIIGEGKREDIVVRSTTAHVILFRTTMGRVANMTLRQLGGNWHAVKIPQGRLDLEDCDISSQGLACILIHDNADPRIRRNLIHGGGNGAGALIYAKGLGTFEDNNIRSNGFPGVEIRDGGNPTLRRNRIHGGKAGGLFIHSSGLGIIEDNEISDNEFTGVEITKGANPALRRNRIQRNKASGVVVHTGGLGTIDDNDISGNAMAGVSIEAGGNPTIRRNRINHNEYAAIRIKEHGGGTFEDNDLLDNKRGAWNIANDCLPNVKRTRNKE